MNYSIWTFLTMIIYCLNFIIFYKIRYFYFKCAVERYSKIKLHTRLLFVVWTFTCCLYFHNISSYILNERYTVNIFIINTAWNRNASIYKGWKVIVSSALDANFGSPQARATWLKRTRSCLRIIYKILNILSF